MKLVGYIRVSTDRQAEDGLGVEIQRDEIKRWAGGRRHRITTFCVDEGVSGTRELDDRPGLAEALHLVRGSSADGLVVYRLDRLARDLILQEQLLREIWSSGGVVHSTSQAESGYLEEDPADPSRRLVRQVLGAVAEYERSMIGLRLRAGRDRKAADGGYAGFGSPALGWRAVDGELVADVAERVAVERILELRATGQSYRQIIAQLDEEGLRPKRGGRWHPTTLARVVERERTEAA